MLRYGILAAMAVLVATPAMAQAPACTPAVLPYVAIVTCRKGRLAPPPLG